MPNKSTGQPLPLTVRLALTFIVPGKGKDGERLTFTGDGKDRRWEDKETGARRTAHGQGRRWEGGLKIEGEKAKG
jgi:hypothetical protein